MLAPGTHIRRSGSRVVLNAEVGNDARSSSRPGTYAVRRLRNAAGRQRDVRLQGRREEGGFADEPPDLGRGRRLPHLDHEQDRAGGEAGAGRRRLHQLRHLRASRHAPLRQGDRARKDRSDRLLGGGARLSGKRAEAPPRLDPDDHVPRHAGRPAHREFHEDGESMKKLAGIGILILLAGCAGNMASVDTGGGTTFAAAGDTQADTTSDFEVKIEQTSAPVAMPTAKNDRTPVAPLDIKYAISG